jgi:hypothetical protein
MSVRRRVHIALTVLAVLVFLKPFDCFAGGFTRKAAACCAKGKCLPSSNADECCKNTVPSGNHLSAPKAPDHAAPLYALMIADLPAVVAAPSIAFSVDETPAPPGSPPNSRLNLPLLI